MCRTLQNTADFFYPSPRILVFIITKNCRFVCARKSAYDKYQANYSHSGTL